MQRAQHLSQRDLADAVARARLVEAIELGRAHVCIRHERKADCVLPLVRGVNDDKVLVCLKRAASAVEPAGAGSREGERLLSNAWFASNAPMQLHAAVHPPLQPTSASNRMDVGSEGSCQGR
jgi:hypothetical protein